MIQTQKDTSLNLYNVKSCKIVKDSTIGNKHITTIVVTDNDGDVYVIYLYNDKQAITVKQGAL